MAQAYSNPKRASDPRALPDVEVFCHNHEDAVFMVPSRCEHLRDDNGDCTGSGWYWWSCFPGCLPDGDPVGPFETEVEALADAQKGCDDDDD